MFRKFALSGLFAASAFLGLTGAAAPARADFHLDLGGHHHHDTVYQVYYRNQRRHSGWNFFRRSDRFEWILYGSYDNERDARRAERRLERSGYDATVRETR